MIRKYIINSYKQVAGQAIFEIGRRLQGVKENPNKYGLDETTFKNWCSEKLEFTRQTADRFIQAYNQFGRHDVVLPSSKIFEMLSLPKQLDRQEFIDSPHTIPSTGDTKTVDEMTVKELREVKKALKEAEEDKKRLAICHMQKITHWIIDQWVLYCLHNPLIPITQLTRYLMLHILFQLFHVDIA